MAKVYRVVITAIDSETNTETVEVDDKYTGLTLVADCVGDEGRMAEIVLHDNLGFTGDGNTTAVVCMVGQNFTTLKG